MNDSIIISISIIVSLSLFVVLGLIEYRARKKHANIQKLISAIFLIAIGNGIMILTNYNYIMQIGHILYNMGFLVLFLHYESIAKDTAKSPLFFGLCIIFVSGLLVSLMFIWLSHFVNIIQYYSGELAFSSNDFFMYPILWFSILYDNIIGIIVFGRAIHIIAQTHKIAHLQATRNELIALIFLLCGRFLNFLVMIISIAEFLIIVSLISSLIGIVLIIANYLSHPDYLYLLPFPIHSLMVYNKDGLLCYSRKVQLQKLSMEDKDFLISGALTAISSLIKETLGAQAKIHHINAQQFQIFFNPLPHENGTFVVIAYGNTALFKNSLRRFTENLTSYFFELINAAGIETDKLQDEIDRIIKDVFPYLQIENRKN